MRVRYFQCLFFTLAMSIVFLGVAFFMLHSDWSRLPHSYNYSTNLTRLRTWRALPSVQVQGFIFNNYRVNQADCGLHFRDVKPKVFQPKNYSSSFNIDVDLLLERAKTTTTSEFCREFRTSRRYVTEYLTSEEASFPVAYNIVVYRDGEQFERLLRVIYRPQNFYCIHVDWSSEQRLHAIVRVISSCFDNVFLPVELIDVKYTQFSSLQADLVCMRELLKYPTWKYLINLTGQEFPLVTNLGLTRVLRIFNGANNIEGTVKRLSKKRFQGAPPPPVNVTLTKGGVHIIASRAFVDYIVNDQRAKLFLAWTELTAIPDETFFSSLNHSPQLGVPGAYLGEPETFTGNYLFVGRFKNWDGTGPDSYPCKGKFVRSICIFGVGDLSMLARRPELFANKFHSGFEPLTLDCLEELIWNRTRDELMGLDHFNRSFYSSLSFVNNHL